MRMILWVACAGVACAGFVAMGGECRGQAVIVEDKNVRFRTISNGRFELTVCPTVTCGNIGDLAESEWANAPFTKFHYSGHSIVPYEVSADAQYYEVVDFGGVFNSYVDDKPFPGGEVGPGSFYLGIWTLALIPQQHSFGWVQLAPVNGVVTMIDNVMSYKSQGVIVGTTMVVPEPTTVLMLVTGLAMFPDRRRGPAAGGGNNRGE